MSEPINKLVWHYNEQGKRISFETEQDIEELPIIESSYSDMYDLLDDYRNRKKEDEFTTD
jgi:hypothetical protein